MNKSADSVGEVHPQTKMILHTVLERCKKEKDHGILQVPLENFIERGSYYTALPATLVSALHEHEKGISQVAYNVAIPTMIAISRSLEKFYAKGLYPTVTTILERIDEFDDKIKKTMTTEQFASFLSFLGYHYKATIPSEKLLLIEQPAITFERTMFLKKMLLLRNEGVKITYLGERFIDSSYNYKKLWPDYKALVNKGEYLNSELILYHIVSKAGFDHYLFTNSTSSKDFYKWFEDIVLPSLESKTAIILENNPLHAKDSQAQISQYHSKSDMLAYLKMKNVPCSSKMSKAELFNLIRRCVNVNTTTTLERLLHAYGHQLLYLPKNYESLSMVELLWHYVNKIISKNSYSHIIQVKEQLEIFLNDGISCHYWNVFSDTIAQQENTLRMLDKNIEEAIEGKYKFQINDSDSGENFQNFLTHCLDNDLSNINKA